MGTEVVTLAGEVLGFEPGTPVDVRIAEVADAQHGPLNVAQLRSCGLGDCGVRRRAAVGRLHRVHRGVYVPGHRQLPPRGWVAAALLACGPGAAASHVTAAWLRDLRAAGLAVIHVAVTALSGRRHGSVVTHSAGRFRPQDVSVVEGIPVTSVARTLLDCAPRLGRRATEKLVAEAEHRGMFDLVAVEDLLAHVPGHHGAGILRAAVADAASAHGQTASAPEDELLLAFRAAGLSEPECNAAIQMDDRSFVHPDFLWRDVRLVVEADPRGSHDRTANYRSDRQRDRALDRLGYGTMRFCDEDLADPVACAVEVKERHDFRAQQARKS